MLRSAINATVMVTARRSLAPPSAAKASLSTLSFNSSLIGDICDDRSNHAYEQVMSSTTDVLAKKITSSISNIFANLSGDAAIISLHQTQSAIEEGNLGLIATKTTASDPFVMKDEEESPLSLSVWLISTLKRRKKMMNKHKLRKRRKKLRLKTRK